MALRLYRASHDPTPAIPIDAEAATVQTIVDIDTIQVSLIRGTKVTVGLIGTASHGSSDAFCHLGDDSVIAQNGLDNRYSMRIDTVYRGREDAEYRWAKGNGDIRT